MLTTQTQAYAEEVASQNSTVPLCVDLDGTLVKSDTLVDSLLVLVRNQPLAVLKVPFWAAGNKAAMKAKVASMVSLDPRTLPYNRSLLKFLHLQHNEGRKIYLTTGADRALAARVADHLGIFSDVLASDGVINLTGQEKLAVLKHRFQSGFDYIGNSRHDFSLLAAAGELMLANPDGEMSALLKIRKLAITRIFEDRNPRLKAIARAARPHQWAKNLLILIPLLLAHRLGLQGIIEVILAALSFSLCASASYILNDLLDIDADRRHAKKRLRPFADGDLSVGTGLGMGVILLAIAFLVAYSLPLAFTGWLILYAISTLTYSLFLKRVVLVDVVLLSGLYTLRLLAGGAAAQVEISPWLAGFSIFQFVSLAMVKRFSELQNNRAQGLSPPGGRGYLLVDTEQLRSLGTASGYAAVVIFSLYISSHDVIALYAHAERMWLIVPLMILWISRVWLLAGRGLIDEDPVVFAITDRMSLLVAVCVVMVGLLAV